LAKYTKSVVPVSLCSRACWGWTIMWNLLVSFSVRVYFSYKIKLTKPIKKSMLLLCFSYLGNQKF